MLDSSSSFHLPQGHWLAEYFSANREYLLVAYFVPGSLLQKIKVTTARNSRRSQSSEGDGEGGIQYHVLSPDVGTRDKSSLGCGIPLLLWVHQEALGTRALLFPGHSIFA